MKTPVDRVISGYLLVAAFAMGALVGHLLTAAYRDGYRLRSPVQPPAPAVATPAPGAPR